MCRNMSGATEDETSSGLELDKHCHSCGRELSPDRKVYCCLGCIVTIYCSEACRESDQSKHEPNCPTVAQSELAQTLRRRLGTYNAVSRNALDKSSQQYATTDRRDLNEVLACSRDAGRDADQLKQVAQLRSFVQAQGQLPGGVAKVKQLGPSTAIAVEEAVYPLHIGIHVCHPTMCSFRVLLVLKGGRADREPPRGFPTHYFDQTSLLFCVSCASIQS